MLTKIFFYKYFHILFMKYFNYIEKAQRNDGFFNNFYEEKNGKFKFKIEEKDHLEDEDVS